MTDCSVYKLDFANGKSYVGISVDVLRRLREHVYSDYPAGRAWRKYGPPGVDILFEGTIDECKDKEVELIFKCGTRAPDGYNLTDGGEGTPGWKATEETKARMSKAQRGHFVSEVAKENMRQAQLGNTASNETKAKMSAAAKGKKKAPFTAEHKAKLSAAKKGCTLSKQHKIKISAALKNRTPEEKEACAAKIKLTRNSRTPEEKAIHAEKCRKTAIAAWSQRKATQQGEI